MTNDNPPVSWEEAVRWLRRQPNSANSIRDNYFDLPVIEAAERYFSSEEFTKIQSILGPGAGKKILDLGAGNGIASYALAKAGWTVTALEPDPSEEVGAGAIKHLSVVSGYSIEVIQEFGEQLPFPDHEFAAVHVRQVLHHLSDLNAGVKEMARVLIPGGLLLATREHVADNDTERADFLRSHPLHSLYQGENAYPKGTYLQAFKKAHLKVIRLWSPLSSILNYHPGTGEELASRVRRITRGGILGQLLGWFPPFRRFKMYLAEKCECPPGRLYSFLLKKTS